MTPRGDLDLAQAAIDAIQAVMQQLRALTPFSFRKAAHNPVQPAVRYQREEDYK